MARLYGRRGEMSVIRKQQFFSTKIRRSMQYLRKAGTLFLTVSMLMMYLTACGSSDHGTPHVMMLGDIEIKPGETKIQELADAGYEFSDNGGVEMVPKEEGFGYTRTYTQVYDLNSKAEARTLYSSVVVLKDGEEAAMISIYNEEEKEITLAQCKISSITVYSTYFEADKVAVEGITWDELSAEALTEVLGEVTRSTDDKVYVWENRWYSLILRYQEDGTIESIATNFNAFTL